MHHHLAGENAFVPLGRDHDDSYSQYQSRGNISPSSIKNYIPKEEYEGRMQIGNNMIRAPGFDYEEDSDSKTTSDPAAHGDLDSKAAGRQATERSSDTSGSLLTNTSKAEADIHRQQVLAILRKLKDSKELLELIDRYQCKNKDLTIEKIKALPGTKVKRFKDSIYVGEIMNSIRHGKGIMIYADTRTYEGDWENDLKHGKGVEILANMNRYEGNFLNGKPDGIGTYIWANGEVYEGQWKNGVKHGSGMWRGKKGETYIGEWKDGKVDGYGVHTWTTGDRYEGELKNYLKHGRGTERFVNGDYYVGSYMNGKPDGYGEYYWMNGSQYKGDFKNGLRHGKGIWKKGVDIADTYDGEWINDKKHGQGTYTWTSGNYYQGAYFDDFRHGYGEMCWSDGSFYKGHWEKGIQHGKGELSVLGEGTKKGVFVNNVYMGGSRTDIRIREREKSFDYGYMREKDEKSMFQAHSRDNSFDHRYKYESEQYGSNIPKAEKVLPELRKVQGRVKERSNSHAPSKVTSSRTDLSFEQINKLNELRRPSPPPKQVIKLKEVKNPPNRNIRRLEDIINPPAGNRNGKKFLQSVWKPAFKPINPEKTGSGLDYSLPFIQFAAKKPPLFNK